MEKHNVRRTSSRELESDRCRRDFYGEMTNSIALVQSQEGDEAPMNLDEA